MDIFISLLSFSFILYLFWKSLPPKQFPPGPWRLPIIGNLLQISMKNPLKDLDKLAQKYGPVYSLRMGGTSMVFIHGFPAVKEILVTKGTEFAGRPITPFLDVLNKKKGIVTAPFGKVWKEQRKFSLMILRNFGVGKRTMEERILDEATYLIQTFEEHMSEPFDPCCFTDNAVTNIISTLVFGKRFEYNDSTLRKVMGLVHQSMKQAAGPWAQLFDAVPLVRNLPLPHWNVVSDVKKVQAFFGKELEEHKATHVPGEHRDFVDAYLDEMYKPENKDSSFEEENLLIIVSDLFIAGSETTTSTLLWGLLYMMAFPDVQVRLISLDRGGGMMFLTDIFKRASQHLQGFPDVVLCASGRKSIEKEEKCQREIDNVLGNNACLKYDDRAKLPYTNAVIHEIQRCASVVPLGIAHAPTTDMQVFGYTIPKGTTVVTSIISVLHDESQWKFPREFNPANFLDEKGGFVKPEAFLPFSAGPRVCLGENLARMEIFLFFTSILRNFQVSWPDETTAPNFTPVFGITLSPPHFNVALKCRGQI